MIFPVKIERSSIPIGIEVDSIPTGRYTANMSEEKTTRRTILETALDLFALQGYEGTGVQQIVDNSGITKPTMYHYFGHKRGLLDEVIHTWGRSLFDIYEKSADYQHDLVMNLNLLTRETITFALANQSFYRLHCALSAAAPGTESHAAYEPLRKDINACIETLFAKASKDHGNMKGREKLYSESFQGMLKAWTLPVLNTELQLTDDLLHRVVHQFMHGIFS